MAIIPTPTRPKKRQHRNEEAVLQAQAWTWLWNTYPETRLLFFAVVNENERSGYESKKMQEISGARRRARGVVSGVSDSVGLIPRGQFHGVCAEAKTSIGVQSAAQKEWQERVESAGYYYFVYRSLDEFKEKMEWYLSLGQVGASGGEIEIDLTKLECPNCHSKNYLSTFDGIFYFQCRDCGCEFIPSIDDKGTIHLDIFGSEVTK